MKRRNWITVFALAILSLGALVYFVMLRKPPVLTVVTWSGAYGRAQASALFLPYSQKTGTNVHIVQYDGGLEELRKQTAAGQVRWDVVDLELPDAIAACDQGLLEPMRSVTLPAGANGEAAQADFVPNALGSCWVGSVVYSQVIAYAANRFGDARPIAASDFFDTVRFPGPRALRGPSPKLNLEFALLADGVAPKDVYRLLATEQGIRRAFAKLDTIRPSIVWWARSSEPVAMLQDGRAAFATVLNGDVYDAAVHGKVIGVIWDRQLYELDVFGIPKGDPKRDMARDFVRFATSASSLAAVANWVPYGPARRSAMNMVGDNPELKIPMKAFSPTAPAHFRTAFAVDDAWWRLHGAALTIRWQMWRNH